MTKDGKLFKKGDVLKIRLDQVEYEFGGCKGTTVYDTMMKAASAFKFEVIDVLPSSYKLKRLPDGQVDVKETEEVHRLLEKINKCPSSS